MTRREFRELMQLVRSSPEYQLREQHKLALESIDPSRKDMRVLQRLAEEWPLGGSEQVSPHIEHAASSGKSAAAGDSPKPAGGNDPAGVVSTTLSDVKPSLATHLKETQKRPDTRQRPDLPPTAASTQTRVPLHAELQDAESRTADPKLRNKLVAVLRYTRYFEDLKVLKAACKGYQTPVLLEQQFPDLDVWAALDDADKADIADGEFEPGHFAWALVKRSLNLTGKDDRTLKNYRRSLKAAGLL